MGGKAVPDEKRSSRRTGDWPLRPAAKAVRASLAQSGVFLKIAARELSQAVRRPERSRRENAAFHRTPAGR